MPLHAPPHPLAGRRVRIAAGRYEGALGELLDWYDRITDRGWREHPLTAPAHAFGFRSAQERTPLDDEVVVVSLATGPFLFHVEQLTTRGAEIPALEHAVGAAIEAQA